MDAHTQPDPEFCVTAERQPGILKSSPKIQDPDILGTGLAWAWAKSKEINENPMEYIENPKDVLWISYVLNILNILDSVPNPPNRYFRLF